MNIRSPKDLANAIRGRRRDLGLTQSELAKNARVSRKWLSEVEAGKPSAETGLVLRVLDALGLRVEVAHQSPVPTAPGIDQTAVLAALDKVQSAQNDQTALQAALDKLQSTQIDQTPLRAALDRLQSAQIDPAALKAAQTKLQSAQIDTTALRAAFDKLQSAQIDPAALKAAQATLKSMQIDRTALDAAQKKLVSTRMDWTAMRAALDNVNSPRRRIEPVDVSALVDNLRATSTPHGDRADMNSDSPRPDEEPSKDD
jgi:HTH-type transcriptional regulator/antitoxin HipB